VDHAISARRKITCSPNSSTAWMRCAAQDRENLRAHGVLGREDVARPAAGLRPLLQGWAALPEERSTAGDLAHLAAQALSADNLFVHIFLL